MGREVIWTFKGVLIIVLPLRNGSAEIAFEIISNRRVSIFIDGQRC